LREFAGKSNPHLGMVSIDIPLISNLDVWNNIALIKQYHANMPESTARQLVFQSLERFGMLNVALKRNPSLTEEERFCVMLLRAVMVKDAIVVLDRPFQILTRLQDARFIYDSLNKVGDLYRDCHIFDYTWNAQRYRSEHDEKS
jgi:ABC-type uncharacterized transport system YnjBCD ATPase subunit